jgi:hypothetical protein
MVNMLNYQLLGYDNIRFCTGFHRGMVQYLLNKTDKKNHDLEGRICKRNAGKP